jgi:signal transduction histidine kinase
VTCEDRPLPARFTPGTRGAGTRTRFDGFLLSLAAALANVPGELVGRDFAGWLRKLARLVRVDRICLWEWPDDGSSLEPTFVYSNCDTGPRGADVTAQSFPWLTEQYRAGHVVVWHRIPEDIPAEATAERIEALRVGARSLLGIPIRLDKGLCVISFTSCRSHLFWPRATIRRLRLIGRIFSFAILRQRAERTLCANEIRHQALLDAERGHAHIEIERIRTEVTYLDRVNLMGHLAASLAHQLLQPVTAILGNAEAGQYLLRNTPTDIASLESILRDIANCGKGAADVIERVRTLLRKESCPEQSVDFNALVKEVVEIMSSDLILRQVRLHARLSAKAARLLGDPVQLQQVVLNLVLNAAEAMSECHIAERVLTISTLDSGADIELVVCDRAPRAEPENLERMFDPFFTIKPGGLGMGLHICAEIVRVHGGRLWAESNDGPGRTVHCLIPLPTRPP